MLVTGAVQARNPVRYGTLKIGGSTTSTQFQSHKRGGWGLANLKLLEKDQNPSSRKESEIRGISPARKSSMTSAELEET